MRIIAKSKVVKSEKGEKDKKFVNYYLELDNGSLIAFKPSFVNDYGKLRAIAVYEEK